MNNKEKFPIGSVAYYIKQYSNIWVPRFGIVLDHYTDCVSLELYDLPELRRINGVKFDEFVTPTRWMKLPKGWTYHTDLVNLTFDDYPNGDGLCIDNPDEVLEAIEKGLLVEVASRDYSNVESEIDSKYGYRLVRKPSQEYHPSCISVRWDRLYKTFDEAKAVITARDVELKAMAELSDYDWAVKDMDRILNQWQKIYGITDELKDEYREWLLDLEHFEDVEIRLFNKNIQWKYWKNKRWNHIEL